MAESVSRVKEHVFPKRLPATGKWGRVRSDTRCIASPRIFPDGFSTNEVFPLHRFSTSAETPPGTKNAKHLVPTLEMPNIARLGKKRKIPDEASGFWLPHGNVTHNSVTTEGPVKSPLSYPARRELVEQMAPQYREAPRTRDAAPARDVRRPDRLCPYICHLAPESSCRIKAEKPACAFCSVWARGPASPLPGMARRQSDLCQTADPFPADTR
jgi:hypothetical protein